MSFKVFGIGEVLWDVLPMGHQLGGAPANFIYHAKSLGADASLITRIGNDCYGHKLLHQFKQKQLSSALVQIDEHHPTSTVDVTFPTPGVPQYVIHEHVAWDFLEATQHAITAINNADAICFGSLSQRSLTARTAITTLLLTAPKTALIVFDVNLRQTFFTPETLQNSLQFANVLKLNSEEMEYLSGLFNLHGTYEQKISWLSRTYDLHTVALTLGAEGSMLYHRGYWSTEPPRKADVVDTVGAGDAFTAALIMGLLYGLTCDSTHSLAAEISGYVCSQAGGMPPLPKALIDKIPKQAHFPHQEN